MAFATKKINVTFNSAVGNFATTQVSGLRTFCHVVAGGENSLIQLDLLIYGMSLAHMNQISNLGWKGQRHEKDTVDVYAGDDVTGMSHVYKGSIWAAYSDFQGGPNLPFHVVGYGGSHESGLIVKPTSINNKSADVAQIMSQLAGQMGLQFENGGVNVKIAYPYLPGSPRWQAWQLAKHADIHVTIDRGVLAIWPKDGNRPGAAVTVSPTTGLVGYPSWASEGIRLKMLYNPDLKIAGKITVQNSAITPANGTWTISRLEHSLQSYTPDGEWFSSVVAWQPKPGQPEPSVSH